MCFNSKHFCAVEPGAAHRWTARPRKDLALSTLGRLFWQRACSYSPGEIALMKTQTVESTCSVEISGWDVDTRFFVERVDLRWEGDGDKFVSLRSIVQDGSLLYVRPISGAGTVGPLLMAYQADLVHDDGSGNGKTYSVRLAPHRRSGSSNAPANALLDSYGEVARNEKLPV